METYPYSVTSSPSSSYSNSCNSSTHQSSSREERSRKPPPAYRSALRSVRKHVITKTPIAPMPPTPPKIYKVEPVNFRDVVQRLTAAPEFQRTRMAPPRSLSQVPAVHPPTSEINLSSASGVSWCSSILLSPGTLSCFEKSAFL